MDIPERQMNKGLIWSAIIIMTFWALTQNVVVSFGDFRFEGPLIAAIIFFSGVFTTKATNRDHNILNRL